MTPSTKREGSDGAQPGDYSCPAYVSGQLTGKLQSDCISLAHSPENGLSEPCQSNYYLGLGNITTVRMVYLIRGDRPVALHTDKNNVSQIPSSEPNLTYQGIHSTPFSKPAKSVRHQRSIENLHLQPGIKLS